MRWTYRIDRNSVKKEMWVIEYFVRLPITLFSVNIFKYEQTKNAGMRGTCSMSGERRKRLEL